MDFYLFHSSILLQAHSATTASELSPSATHLLTDERAQPTLSKIVRSRLVTFSNQMQGGKILTR